jgi:hypothetical protein
MVAAQEQVQKALFGVFLIGAVLLFAVLLGSVQVLALMGFVAVIWALTLPQHATLALILGSVMINSSLLVPFVSGRPFFWEASLMLSISGLPLMFAMRRSAPDFGDRLREFRWAFVGLGIFFLVLLSLIKVRGFGLNVLGQGQVGGRAYVTQFLGLLFPLLYMAVPTTPQMLVRIYIAHCLMSVTFLVSDFTLAAGTGPLWVLLSFFGLSTDSLAFEVLSLEGGVRRFQSVAFVSRDLIYLMLVLIPASRALTLGTVTRLLLVLGLLAGSALGGHRMSMIIIPSVILLSSLVQRTVSMAKVTVSAILLVLALLVTYQTARHLPHAAQRMLSVLPGIEIDPLASVDAENSTTGRSSMRRIAFDIAPNFLWVGRGLGFVPDIGHLYTHNEIDQYGMLEQSLDQGIFYAGIPSLLVNLGLPGLAGVGLFLGAVSMVALRNLKSIHRMGCETSFDRLTCHVSSLWVVQLVTFMSTTGEAGFFMQTFGMLSGLVLVTHWHRTHTLHLDAPAPKTLFRIAARDDDSASPAGSGQPAA